MTRILVVDDKDMMRDSVAATLARKDYAVSAAANGKAALAKLEQQTPTAIVTDLQMPEMNGLELLAEVRQRDEQIPVIFMTAFGTIETAVEAMKQGAFDYITKPFSGDELLVAVDRAVAHAALVKENQILKAKAGPAEARSGGGGGREMVGQSMTMQHLRRRLARIADSHGTVLISGESGVGKEVAAQWIHENSPRADQPFLAINCAALSTNLLESELFGHEKGAFTGADKLRKGRFELADGGTLLLDEISEIAPEIQAKLLRVLQEKCFERVGSSTSRNCDVRVIATTNRDLSAEVAKGTFRQDLYYRLNVLPIVMPTLRQRRDDVPELASHFLDRVARREGRAARVFEEDALLVMRNYAWPGNVRELQNICERAAVLTDGELIPAELIEPWLSPTPVAAAAPVRGGVIIETKAPAHLARRAEPATVAASGLAAERMNGAADQNPAIVCDGDLTLEEIERETIIATLHHHNGHRQKSARALGIGVRTLGLKLKKWKEMELVDPDL